MDIQKAQAEFMTAGGQTVRHSPISSGQLFDSIPEYLLHKRLISEEYDEFINAMGETLILADVCSEAVDLVYVTMGLMNYLGLPFMEMFNEVHKANMNKTVDGKLIRREDGKVLKPDGWKPADTHKVIEDAISCKPREPSEVTIPIKEYNRLVARDTLMASYEAVGVDNWQGSDNAREIYEMLSK